MDELCEIPIHRALNRPNLLLGGEREWVLFTGLIAFTLIVGVMSWSSAIIGLTLWIVALGIFRRMAKIDPQLSRVYFRHILKYNQYYPARARIGRK